MRVGLSLKLKNLLQISFKVLAPSDEALLFSLSPPYGIVFPNRLFLMAKRLSIIKAVITDPAMAEVMKIFSGISPLAIP